MNYNISSDHILKIAKYSYLVKKNLGVIIDKQTEHTCLYDYSNNYN